MSNKLETVLAYLPLFVPATRPERFDRAASSGATAIIVDLEDGVSIDAKESARRHLKSSITDALALQSDVFVRINAFDTQWNATDLRLVADLPEMGMGGKLLIRPSQIAPARQAYRPSDTDLKRARNLLQLPENGVLASDGMMVDAPVITWARRILATAAALGVDE